MTKGSRYFECQKMVGKSLVLLLSTHPAVGLEPLHREGPPEAPLSSKASLSF